MFAFQQVNGQDLTTATHAESVRALSAAHAPIVIEAERQASVSASASAASLQETVSQPHTLRVVSETQVESSAASATNAQAANDDGTGPDDVTQVEVTDTGTQTELVSECDWQGLLELQEATIRDMLPFLTPAE